MSFQTTRIAVLALVAPLAMACDLSTDPPPPSPPTEITLDFCDDETPVWFAYRNENEPWREVVDIGQGTFTFSATPLAAIAFVRQNGSNYRTDVIFTTSDDLENISGLVCLEERGTKQVNGSVAGLSGSQTGLASMSFSSAIVSPGQTSFTLTGLPNRALDLIATRIDVVGDTQHANAAVIRRAQTPANGATLTPIDFNAEGSEMIALTVGVNIAGASDFAQIVNSFSSSLGTSHVLSSVQQVRNGPVPFVALPVSATVTDDFHALSLVASTADGAVRGIERFFRNAGDHDLALNPPLNDVVVGVIATQPYLRLATQVPGQFEYGSVLVSEYSQVIGASTIELVATATASIYGGTPSLWSIPTPDFSGIAGYDEAWALQEGFEVFWTVTAYSGRPERHFGAKPIEGETVSFASETASTATARTAVVERVPRRPLIARWR